MPPKPQVPPEASVTMERALRERISSHAIPPGSRLNEVELADEFRVSRAQVREALAELAFRGLIERVPNKGAVVCRLGAEQVIEIFTVREALEGTCARLAALNSTAADWDRHAAAFDKKMPAALNKGDFAAFLAHYQGFRADIVLHARNATLEGMLDSIQDRISILARRIIILPGRGEQALKEHRRVFEALRAGDADAAERLRKENMRSGLAWFLRYKDFIL